MKKLLSVVVCLLVLAGCGGEPIDAGCDACVTICTEWNEWGTEHEYTDICSLDRCVEWVIEHGCRDYPLPSAPAWPAECNPLECGP